MDTYSSFIFLAITEASVKLLAASRESINAEPLTFDKLSSCLSKICATTLKLMFNFLSKKGRTFLSTREIALKICSFSI